MPFQLSPGVNVTEIDLTTIVPAVATSTGAIAGIFNWGPVGERILVDTETKLVSVFGKPNSNNAETFFTAANFLSYGNSLYVVRAANTTSVTANVAAFNAVANQGAVAVSSCVIKNEQDFSTIASFDSNAMFVARYPGALGNSLKVSVCDSVNAYSETIDLTTYGGQIVVTVGNTYVRVLTSNNATAGALEAKLAVGDNIILGNTTIGTQNAQIKALALDGSDVVITLVDRYRLSTNYDSYGDLVRYWESQNVVDAAPAQTEWFAQEVPGSTVVDGMHVVVTDELGRITGVPGTILEVYRNVSRAENAKTVGGATNFWRTVINNSSQYVWAVNDRPDGESYSGIAANIINSNASAPLTLFFAGGQDGDSESNATLATIASGYDMFLSTEDADVSLVLQGKPIGGTTTMNGISVSNFQLANYLIDNIVEVRKDCVAFITPDDAVVTSNRNNESTAIVAWRNAIHDSSYAVMDSGYKYQYDRYNDVYRYLPTNGDIAGLCARTDSTRDAWWSPAGFNRGQIKNLVKLRYNPGKADRDNLYKNGVNPVVTFPGQGTVLFGDKTLQTKPSAFDRINVRRLFIVLEKAIATASKFTLFEFNDTFTRSQFVNLITPYLRDVQARRGVTDFLVVCDESNNTPERIDRNEFWGDIYIKPARSINFIQLNFVAVRTGVQFSEIVGQF